MLTGGDISVLRRREVSTGFESGAKVPYTRSKPILSDSMKWSNRHLSPRVSVFLRIRSRFVRDGDVPRDYIIREPDIQGHDVRTVLSRHDDSLPVSSMATRY